MSNVRSWLTAIGLGAGLMYLLDPQHGSRRRAQLRDQIGDLKHVVNDAVHGVRSLGNRASDLVLETRQVAMGQRDWRDVAAMRGEQSISAEQLASRVRPINPRSLAVLGGGLMLLSSMSRRSRMATAGRWLGIGLLAGGMMKARSEHSDHHHLSASSEGPRAHNGETERTMMVDCAQAACDG